MQAGASVRRARQDPVRIDRRVDKRDVLRTAGDEERVDIGRDGLLWHGHGKFPLHNMWLYQREISGRLLRQVEV